MRTCTCIAAAESASDIALLQAEHADGAGMHTDLQQPDSTVLTTEQRVMGEQRHTRTWCPLLRHIGTLECALRSRSNRVECTARGLTTSFVVQQGSSGRVRRRVPDHSLT